MSCDVKQCATGQGGTRGTNNLERRYTSVEVSNEPKWLEKSNSPFKHGDTQSLPGFVCTSLRFLHLLHYWCAYMEIGRFVIIIKTAYHDRKSFSEAVI